MKYISFSLWLDPSKPDTHAKYLEGAIRNAELCKTIYPDWKPVFHLDSSVKRLDKNRLYDSHNNLEIVECQGMDNISAKSMWRFLVNDRRDMEAWISRDTDSRVSQREADLVAMWLAGSASFHIIRDHASHVSLSQRWPILAGMFGVKRGFVKDLAPIMQKWTAPDVYGSDQDFLAATMWPKAKGECLIHNGTVKLSTGNVFAIPASQDKSFVGQRINVIDGKDVPFYE